MFYVKFLKSLYYRVYLSVYMIYISNQSINQSITAEDRSKIENSCCIVEYHKSIYIRILYYTIYITIVYSTSLYMYPSIYSSIRQSIHPSIHLCMYPSIYPSSKYHYQGHKLDLVLRLPRMSCNHTERDLSQ